MAWLERIVEREGHRMSNRTADITSRQVAALQHQVAVLGDRLRSGGGHAQHAGSDFAHYAGRAAGDAAHQFADLARSEGALVARVAAKQAVRAGRALKADPMPAIIGAVGIALFISLVSGRKPARRA